jgi:ankyrin repeat protein
MTRVKHAVAMIRTLAVLLLILLTAYGDDSRVRGLIEAAGDNDIDRMSLLIDGGANVNGFALDSWTPLTRAAYAGHLEAARLLLARGADINDGAVTPLYWAASRGHLEVARTLVRGGARLKLLPAGKRQFLEKVRSYRNDELLSLVAEVMARENS